MAAFAPVAPIGILEEMGRRSVLGNYHLLLAHHVLEEPERFENLFGGAKTLASTIIMDNSLVELGDAATPNLVLEAIGWIPERHHVFPVLTDVMGEGAATREAATESYAWWTENQGPGSRVREFMVVLQGNDWEDYCASVDYFFADRSKFPRISYAGIPRILTDTIGSRQLAVQYLQAIAPDISIHLLGFSENVVDDVITAQHPGVEGIDSAVPLRYAYSASQWATSDTQLQYSPTSSIPPRPSDWFEHGTFGDADFINLANIRKWVA